jgi:NitT/TauT family transport system substrate-binding protein
MSRTRGRFALTAAALAAIAMPAHAQTPREVVSIGLNTVTGAPVFIALENGYWAAQGLDVKIRIAGSGRQIAQALNAGEAQLGHAALATSTASARAGGSLLKGIMPYSNAADHVAKAGARAIIARKDRGIDADKPATMQGKKIAILAGSTNEVYLREWFKRHGLDIRTVQLVNMPVEDTPVTITQGLVDAIATAEPYTAQALRQLGQNGVTVSRGEAGLVADVVGVIANENWTKGNPALIEPFLVGLAQAAQFIRQNPGPSAEIITRYLDGLTPEIVAESLKYMQWDPRFSVCTVHGINTSANDMIKSGLLKRANPFGADELYDGTALARVMASHPQFFADLPPLPAALAGCKGQLGG